MKKIFAAAAAMLFATTVAGSAADLAVKAAPMPAPVWSWTGFYLGVHGGGAWGTTESTLTSVTGGGLAVPVGLPIAQNSRSGFLGGGQIGYNYQSGWAVFGVQADAAAMDVKGTTPCLGGVLGCTAKSDWLATATGRLGGVVADRALVYVKGGAAWMHTDHSLTIPGGGLIGPVLPGVGTIGASTTALGWLLGFGTEYAFSPNWSAFVEYNYIEFDKKNAALDFSAFVGAPAALNVDFKSKLSIAKVGVNYKF